MRGKRMFLRLSAAVCFALSSMLVPTVVKAFGPITVDCSNPKAKVKTIAQGLAQTPTAGPATLLVSGTCHENVTIQNYQYLTIQGNPTATIDGGSDINFDAVDITYSREVTLNDLTVSGGGDGIVCGSASVCRANNLTVEGTLDTGIVVGADAYFRINRSTLQENAVAGLWLVFDAGADLFGSTVQDNGLAANGLGIVVDSGSRLRITNDFETSTVPSVIQNNGPLGGIYVEDHASVFVTRASITGNGGAGINVRRGSEATMLNVTVTGNAGGGVFIRDLSFAKFNGASLVVNSNSGEDVSCHGAYPATQGIQLVLDSGGATNCPAEQ